MTENKFILEADEELRIVLEEDEEITVEMSKGSAEIFGYELMKDLAYNFDSGCKFSIFTFHGCTLSINGQTKTPPLKTKENPMIMYLQVHAGLEQMRKNAEESSKLKPDSGTF